METVLEVVVYLVPMILSLSIHEWAHAWSARKLGDDTAERAGRMTLNPMSHIDPFGTLLIPVVGIISGAPFFGWAKPVPVNPVRFRRDVPMKRGMWITAIAGPASNIVLAVAFAGITSLLWHFGPNGRLVNHLFEFLAVMVALNVGLAVFNMLPVPPLDGSRILYGLLPRNKEYIVDRIGQFTIPLFILILFFGARVLIPVMRVILTGIGFLVGLPELGRML